jgi:hypothetical protein
MKGALKGGALPVLLKAYEVDLRELRSGLLWLGTLIHAAPVKAGFAAAVAT